MDVPKHFRWRPATTVVLLGGFALILIAIIAAFITANFKPTETVKIGGGVYHLWVASTPAELEQGLSGVESLKPNGGLLMDFQVEANHGIWMKDMKIPLDIVWLDGKKSVVFIRENVSPDLGTSTTFVPRKPARYVLELPAESVKKAGIRLGQTANFSLSEERR